MPEDDDNEALDKARDIVEDFVDQLEADAEHDQKFLRQIQKLQNIGVQTRQKMAESSENAANGEKRRTRMRRGWQNDDDNERKNSKENNNMRQTRRIERNEQAILKRIDRIIRSQQRIIERLERRISRIDNLIGELRS